MKTLKINVHGDGYLAVAFASYLSSLGHSVGFTPIDGPHPKIEPELDRLYSDCWFAEHRADVALNWFAYDTPITADGTADVESIVAKIVALPVGIPVFVSSQIPVGTIAKIEAISPKLRLAYVPENVRVGKALNYLNDLDRVVVGTRHEELANLARHVFPTGTSIYDMSPESAEMVKHCINCFLAACIAFANEMGQACSLSGASTHEVFQGFRSERRVGKFLPLAPGGPFQSGHLERDLRYVSRLFGDRQAILLRAITCSNDLKRNGQ